MKREPSFLERLENQFSFGFVSESKAGVLKPFLDEPHITLPTEPVPPLVCENLFYGEQFFYSSYFTSFAYYGPWCPPCKPSTLPV